MDASQQIKEKQSQIDRLKTIIERLRGENGCPWDKAQTPQSMTVYLVEEVYELIDAIYADNAAAVCEELGDVLFQLLFIAAVYRERGGFDVETAAGVSADKMVRRHPHVFGDRQADTVHEVKKRWHEIKKQEKGAFSPASLMDSVPRNLPALIRAYRLTSRAARAGFDWQNKIDVMAKVEEELAELSAAVAADSEAGIVEEFGDLLFTFVNLSRFLRLHPETALAGAISKFEARFRYMEKILAEQGETIEETGLEALDVLWEESKEAVGR